MGKKTNAVWAMTRAEITEKARKDLGMTPAQLSKETVTSLRKRLRSQKAVTELLEDLLAKLPKGLDSMLKVELEQERLLRAITLPSPCAQPEMIVLIEDDVAR